MQGRQLMNGSATLEPLLLFSPFFLPSPCTAKPNNFACKPPRAPLARDDSVHSHSRMVLKATRQAILGQGSVCPRMTPPKRCLARPLREDTPLPSPDHQYGPGKGWPQSWMVNIHFAAVAVIGSYLFLCPKQACVLGLEYEYGMIWVRYQLLARL